MSTIETYRGDDREFTFTLTEDGGAMDLTGAALRFTVKRAVADLDINAVVSKTLGSGITVAAPLTGVCVVALAAADTAGLEGSLRLPFDLQVTRGGRTRTVVVGDLVVIPDVSRSAP